MRADVAARFLKELVGARLVILLGRRTLSLALASLQGGAVAAMPTDPATPRAGVPLAALPSPAGWVDDQAAEHCRRTVTTRLATS